MLPLDLHKWRISSLEKRLWKLKDAGVHGVMCDIWWGLVEKKPKEYEFATYTELANLCQKVDLDFSSVPAIVKSISGITISSRTGSQHPAMLFCVIQPPEPRNLHGRLASRSSSSCRSTSAVATSGTLAACRSPSGCRSVPTGSGAMLPTTRTSAGVTSALPRRLQIVPRQRTCSGVSPVLPRTALDKANLYQVDHVCQWGFEVS